MIDFATIFVPTKCYLVVRTQQSQIVPGKGTFYKEYVGEFLVMPEKCPDHMQKFLACWPTRKNSKGVEIPQKRFFYPDWQENSADGSAIVYHHKTREQYIRVAFTEATQSVYRWGATGLELSAEEMKLYIRPTKPVELKPTIITFRLDSILDSCLV